MCGVWRPSWPVMKVRLFPLTKRSVTKANFCHSTFAVQSLMYRLKYGIRRSVDGLLTACGPSWPATTVRLSPASARTFTKVTFRHNRVTAQLSCVCVNWPLVEYFRHVSPSHWPDDFSPVILLTSRLSSRCLCL